MFGAGTVIRQPMVGLAQTCHLSRSTTRDVQPFWVETMLPLPWKLRMADRDSITRKIASLKAQIAKLDSQREILFAVLGKLEGGQEPTLQSERITPEKPLVSKPAGAAPSTKLPPPIADIKPIKTGPQASVPKVVVKAAVQPVAGGNTGSVPPSFRYEPAPTAENISLFMALFHGRQDVFARRWENQQGHSGYSPACRNEWGRDICDKRLVACADCAHREFVLVTEDVIAGHLTGRATVGVYPMLPDETCGFLAVDFDKATWQEDVSAFIRICRDRNLSCAVERSRSGNGAHVWFFFTQPVAARPARRFACALLTETMEFRHQVGLDSYDRLFPSQDTMPRGGFGNLIALPLQAGPARQGNSLFVDGSFAPYADQWEFLRSVRRLTPETIAAIEADSARRGRIIGVRMSGDGGDAEDPWLIPPSGRRRVPEISGQLPDTVEMVLSNLVYVDKTDLPAGMINRIMRIAAFQNPEFYRAQSMRLSTFGKPRVIACAEEFERHVAVPRGCRDEVEELCRSVGIKVSMRDERNPGRKIKAVFQGQLTCDQEEAVAAMLKHDIGVLSAPTAFGKTVVAARLIAARKVNTLVLVHRKQLLDQWHARLAAFLDLDADAVGRIGAGKKQGTGIIDVAMLQSLQRKGVVADLVADYGMVIVDECHHLPAFTFEAVLRRIKARFVVGLTATPVRKDGHHPIMFMQCGPIRYGQSARKAAAERGFDHRVVLRYTDTTLPVTGADPTIHDVYARLAGDPARTELIVRDVAAVLKSGRHPLVLTERRDHLETIEVRLKETGCPVVILHGGVPEKARREAMKRLAAMPPDAPWAILATGRYIGEGFDEPRLDTLLLTMPVSWRGILNQYAGRLHRQHYGKTEVVIYDYVDDNIAMTRRMLQRRRKGYDLIGYRIEDPLQPGLDTIERIKDGA